PAHPFDPRTRSEVFRVDGEESAAELARRLAAREALVRVAVPAVVDQEGFTKYFLPGETTVQFRNHVSHEDALRKIDAAGSAVIHDHWTPGYYTVSVPAGTTVFDAVRSWYEDPDVLFSEPSYMLYDDALHTPNDPMFDEQWGLRNTGQYDGTPGADVEAELAWDLQKGIPSVIVCVIDTGMDLQHEDLVDNLLPRGDEDWDFASADGSPDDTGNHGTACSGIAVAVQDNGLGVTGIAPGCRIMPLRINLASGQNQNRADAINYAASRRAEFDGLVMSCSWRMSTGDFTAVQNALVNADALDCVTVFASGNSDNDVNYPAAYPETIACGASSMCDERKTFDSCDGENFWGSCWGPELDVVAPGVKIATTDRSGGVGYSGGDYYSSFNGTSSATPLAAGICALIWSANPGLSAHEVRSILQESAEDQVGPPDEDTPGWDPYMGHGRVNAYQAVLMASVYEDFEDDMESGGDDWSHAAIGEGTEDAWHLSQQRNHTEGGNTSYKSGDPDGGPYGTEIHAALESPWIQLGANGRLIFWHWMDAYSPGGDTAGDAGVLEIRTNESETWALLHPTIGSYRHVWRALAGPFFLLNPVWSGSFGWNQVMAELDDYEGKTIRFRFRFGSRGEEPTGEGWYVDDVQVWVPDPAGVDETVRPFGDLRLAAPRPNPFAAGTTISYRLGRELPVTVSIVDVAGRTVRSWDRGSEIAGEHAIVWDGTDGAGRPAGAGIYFANVRAGRLTEGRRLVLLR
ncbi:MAG: S8 family serine peptidase, partial [Candidatus Eisenbacteria bacterium]|nr:S8 family serine peptidase [Candidatus Latescibacterota bacterium]MBD3302929.1 S8 family serine peptidase [Candidatus Eisenbacteria bacterium]